MIFKNAGIFVVIWTKISAINIAQKDVNLAFKIQMQI